MANHNPENWTLKDFELAIKDNPTAKIDVGSIKLYLDLREKELIKKIKELTGRELL